MYNSLVIPRQKQEFVKDALFISYTALKDFLKCPRAYYLKNRYRNPKTGYRIQILSPYLTLGSLVHEAIKWYLMTQRTADKNAVIKNFRSRWSRYRGKKGGFENLAQEAELGKRGLKMIDNFFENQTLEPNLPLFDFLRLRIGEKIFLNGKVDFVGELADGSLHILDFKTGTKEEDDPIQLHAYAILAQANTEKKVSKISYWYLDKDINPKEAVLDSLDDKLVWIAQKCKEIESFLQKNEWVCVKGEDLCMECRNYNAVIEGKGQFQYSDHDFKKDMYYLPL